MRIDVTSRRLAVRRFAPPVLLACVLALTGAAAATAATSTLTGKFGRNDSNSKITIKVEKSKKGVPTRIASFNISGATAECYDQDENRLTPGPDVSGKLGSFKITAFKQSGQKTSYNFSATKTINGVKHTVTGSVAANGRSASGSVRSKPTPAPKCSIPENTFTAKAAR
jgi:hypothetical protein